MTIQKSTAASQVCENLLSEEKRYNTEKQILRSENRVIDRLIDRGVEMSEVYGELCEKLESRPPALQVFLRLVLSAAAFWNPDKIKAARDQRARLDECNRHIATCSGKLADLLRKRSKIENSASFGSNTHYSMCGVIEAAGATNFLFQSYVERKLQALHGQYDLKYWPSLADCIQEIANNAGLAEAEAIDPITASATSSSRTSLSDFFRALFAAVSESRAHLPSDFSLTDKTWATLANCALGLVDDDMVEASYVKQLRQRLRNQD